MADEKQAYKIDKELEKKVDTIKNIFNKNFNTKVKIKIYPDLKSYDKARELIGSKPLNMINSACVNGYNILVCSGGEINLAIHEYIHLAIYSIPTTRVYNSWIDESVCDYLADLKWVEVRYLKVYYTLKRSNFLIDFVQDNYTAKLLYYIGQYLFETYGNEKVINLLKTRSIVSGLGISEEAFWKSWCAWVESLENK